MKLSILIRNVYYVKTISYEFVSFFYENSYKILSYLRQMKNYK